MNEFNLKDIYRTAFGYEPPKPFEIEKAHQRQLYTTGKGQALYETDLFGREHFLPVSLNGQLIPFAVMSMTWKKTIVSTPMPERQGSVHEIISIDDYTFNIKGLLIDEDNRFPESEIIRMHDLFSINTNVAIRSALSAIVLKAEPRIIIKDIKWPATPGIEHVKAFEMDCESDQIFTLEV